MFGWLTNLRNRRSANKHGWTPEWFGAHDFDKELSKKVSKFQEACGLWANGVVDRETYKKALLARLKRIRRRLEWKWMKRR